MSYRMNIGKELSQIKNCTNIDEIKTFLEDHNLIFDHWYVDGTTSDFSDKKPLYVVAYYQDSNGTFIHFTFNF